MTTFTEADGEVVGAIDIVEGGEIRQDQDAITIDRVATIKSPVFASDPAFGLIAAIRDPRLPLMFAAHPFDSRMTLQSRTAFAVQGQPGVVKVVMSYKARNFDFESINVGYSHTRQTHVETESYVVKRAPAPPTEPGQEPELGEPIGIEREPMVVSHTFPDTAGEEGQTIPGRTESNPVKLNVQRSHPIRRYTRLETKDPAEKQKEIIDTVNRAGIWGSDPGFWLCTRLDGETSDNGQSWTVDYEFQFNSQKWRTRVLFKDRTTGLVPEDAKPKLFATYLETDFRTLNLDARLIGDVIPRVQRA